MYVIFNIHVLVHNYVCNQLSVCSTSVAILFMIIWRHACCVRLLITGKINGEVMKEFDRQDSLWTELQSQLSESSYCCDSAYDLPVHTDYYRASLGLNPLIDLILGCFVPSELQSVNMFLFRRAQY